MRIDRFVLGTAGHIDHGKSALVKALTGTDPDRLKEEKARGITIDLGFAWLREGDLTVGLVDPAKVMKDTKAALEKEYNENFK